MGRAYDDLAVPGHGRGVRVAGSGVERCIASLFKLEVELVELVSRETYLGRDLVQLLLRQWLLGSVGRDDSSTSSSTLHTGAMFFAV